MAFFFLLFFFFYLPGFSLAAEPKQEETLKPVVVTATRIETPQEEITTSITVITAEQIRQQQAETVLEVLRSVPGLDVVQTGSRGNVTSVFVRGSNSNHVLVLIDGIEANSTTTGGFDFAHLTTENVERIEILRGAGGTLYGSQAIGGVVHILTKAGKGKPQVTFSAEGGNGRTHRQSLALRGGTERLGYSLSASRLESAGFHRFNDDYQNLATSGRLDLKVTDSALLKGIFHFRKTDLGVFNSNNFIPLPDPNARLGQTDYLAKLEWAQGLLQNWDYRLSGSLFKEHLKFSDDPEPGSFDGRTRNRFRPRILSGEFQTNYHLQEWSTTTFGMEYKKRQATTDSVRKDQRNLGYYLQEQIRFLDGRLTLIPGVRLDDHQAFGTEWTPSFSTAYLFKETGTKIKAGYAEGFKAPSLNELFFPPFLTGCPSFGNPDLGPETSWELNAGVEQSLFSNRVKLGGTYFHREVKDLIEARPTPAPPPCPLPTVFRAQNVGQARLDGVEWGINIKILSNLSLGANYTYLDWDTQNGKLARRPRHRGSVNLNYVYEGLGINLDANMVGKRADFRAAPPFGTLMLPGHVKFDLATSYALPLEFPLVKGLTLFGKIENLFNKKYQEADGFRARPLNFLIGIRGVFGREWAWLRH